MSEQILEQTRKVYDLLSADPAVAGQARRVKDLLDKLENKNLTVSIIGQFKRGKSTLANAILEDEILPVGIVPITSAVTKVVYGKKRAEVRFFNGRAEEIPFSRLSEFISEQENADNKLGVSEVEIGWPSRFLKHGITFVDTPGVGSFHQNNTETAYQYMKESDAVIFLLSVDSPINQIEIDFLQNTGEFAGKLYFAVNKADTASESDLAAYVQYCRALLCRLTKAEDVQLFAVSAKTGIGVEELKKAIHKDLKASAREILEISTEKKLKEIIKSALRQLDFYWKAMNMEYKELDLRFSAVAETIEGIKERAQTCENLFELHLNETKLELSAKVEELFGMEYEYEIDRLPAGLVTMSKEKFLTETEVLCSDLLSALNSILLYREENAYAVVRRINGINRLTRQLRRIRDQLN